MIQQVFEGVILVFDCKVTQGWRGEGPQNEAFEMGRSTKRWPDSKHNHINVEGEPESRAIDAIPYPVSWPDSKNPKEWFRWYYFAGIVVGVAHDMGVPLRSGLNWDRDTYVLDQQFMDGPHFELVGPES